MVQACTLCDIDDECDDQHLTSVQHRFNCALQEFIHKKSNLKGNRYGVELSIEIIPLNGYRYDFTVQPDKKGRHFLNISPENFQKNGNHVVFKVTIKNVRKREDEPFVITFAGVLHPYKHFKMIDPNNEEAEHRKFIRLESGSTYDVQVVLDLEETHVSNFNIPIYFSFQTFTNTKSMKAFSVARSIVVAIHGGISDETPLEKSPFTSNRWEKVKIIPPKKKFRLNDSYCIPEGYMRILLSGLRKDFGDGKLQEILSKLEPGYVTMDNYNHFFHIMLWLEEVCNVIGLSCYNMENVNLKHLHAGVLELEVPGLAEKRPSVVKGDLIEIKIHGDHTAYQGIIQRIGDKTVEIHYLDDGIVSSIKYSPDLEIDVRFVLGRLHYERMHAGVEEVVRNGLVKSLFPSEGLANRRISEPIEITENSLFNKNIWKNAEQLTAVKKIINHTSKGAPYIVNGPPGTGKTVTIVEAIYHLKNQNKKILICAPSNAACNMLTEKLRAFCSTDELKRIISENCDLSTIHNEIVNFCNIVLDSSDKIVTPFPESHLKKYQILVTTLVLAGKYTRKYCPDVVFIDEAAQAREPEACCAMGLLMENDHVILAGDPKQLGPVVHSTLCREYKYQLSILERLCELPLYQKDTNNNFTTMLKLNFRSHPDILYLPNRMFYDNQLKAVSINALNDPLAKVFVYKMIVGANKKGNQPAAIEFCSVLAKEKREGRSPSYFNPSETLLVYKYVKKLLSLSFDNPNMKVTADQIGVVTPYIRQVYKIRDALFQYKGIEVGTTEAFQGREKRVIIISTVRGQEDLLLYDQLYKLGFVGEEKRFNVAITRAKSKLIVIGNPLVLSRDEKWREFIDQARGMGTLCGAPYQERTTNIKEDITRRLKNLKLKDD